MSTETESPVAAHEAARKRMLAEKLKYLSSWCLARVADHTDHDVDTTLTMLSRKVEEIRSETFRAGHRAFANWNVAREGTPACFTVPDTAREILRQSTAAVEAERGAPIGVVMSPADTRVADYTD